MNPFIKIIISQRHKGTKKILGVIFFSALLFISCSKKEEKIPDNILSKNKMIQVLVDVHIAEATIQNKYLALNDSTKNIAAGYYINAFDKNKITEQQFRESFLYYSHHLDLLNKIYEEVINELSKRKSHIPE